MSDVERNTATGERGDEMGGVPYPSNLTMPDPRKGDRGGDFEGETDPRVQGEGTDEGTGGSGDGERSNRTVP